MSIFHWAGISQEKLEYGRYSVLQLHTQRDSRQDGVVPDAHLVADGEVQPVGGGAAGHGDGHQPRQVVGLLLGVVYHLEVERVLGWHDCLGSLGGILVALKTKARSFKRF